MKIDVLDHGYVRYVDHMGGDLSIVRSARVSHNADWREGTNKEDEKLIKYLWRNRHTTPFEAVVFTFEINAPIFVFRQWHRHRTWSYNEMSARYTELEDLFYIPDPDLIGEQHKSNKQARNIGKVKWSRWLETKLVGAWFASTYALYRFLLWRGWPRELARIVLPLSVYSRMFGTVNLNNLFKFLELRDHSHAQYEVQVYARAMLELIRTHCPVAVSAFESARDEERELKSPTFREWLAVFREQRNKKGD